MPQAVTWEAVFDSLYDAYFQELLSVRLGRRWQKYNLVASFLVAITASGSAVTSLALWQRSDMQWVWTVLSAIAAVTSILHGVARVQERLKAQEDLRGKFCGLRVKLDTLAQEVRAGNIGQPQANQYTEYRQMLGNLTQEAPNDLAYTDGLGEQAKKDVNDALRRKGYIA